MRRPSAKTQLYREMTTQEQILNLTLAGYEPKEIATELKIQPTYVFEALNEALANSSEALIEKAARVALLNLMRLQEVISHLREPALGIPPEWADTDTLRENPYLARPDHRLLKPYLDTIKMQMEIAKIITGQDKGKDAANINIERMEVTFTGDNPLYQKAKEDMQADWMAYADEDLTDLLMIPSETDAEVPMVIPDQEKRINEIEKRLHLTDEEEEENEED